MKSSAPAVGSTGAGRLPVWLATLPPEDKAALRIGNEYYWGGSSWSSSADAYDKLTDALLIQPLPGQQRRRWQGRHQIHHIFGTAGKPISLLGDLTSGISRSIRPTSKDINTTASQFSGLRGLHLGEPDECRCDSAAARPSRYNR